MRVAVIISTYNGEKYLQEQIDSILSQSSVDVEIFIRDDGSTDSTKTLLSEYVANYVNIHVDFGSNIGYPKSFFLELFKAGEFDYYSFSDQDDYWDHQKLYKACMMLSNFSLNKSGVYYSNLEVCNKDLIPIKVTKFEERKKTLESVTTRRSIAGCTMVINRELYTIIVKNQDPNVVVGSHDNYIISLCYAIGGQVICDKTPYIKHRQHSSNTSGATNSVIKRIRKELKEIKNTTLNESLLARSLLDNYSDEFSEETIRVLEQISNLRCSGIQRLKAFFSPRFTTGNLILTVVGKIKIIMGHL